MLIPYRRQSREPRIKDHTALIGRVDMEAWIDDGAHLLRSLFGQAQRYRHAGVTRDDMAANNARALAAIDKLGLPPMDILEGHRRSQFAPPIVRRGAAAVDDADALLEDAEELPTTVDDPEDEA
jgi:integrating conjugative element protein (TIGR03761 family)